MLDRESVGVNGQMGPSTMASGSMVRGLDLESTPPLTVASTQANGKTTR